MSSTKYSLVMLVAALVACSGGTEGDYAAGPGPSPTEPGQGPGLPGGNPFNPSPPPTSTSTSSSSSSASSGNGGGGSCTTCNDFLAGGDFSAACNDSAQIIVDLINCMCQACLADCGTECQALTGPTGACGSCVSTSCTGELSSCTAD